MERAEVKVELNKRTQKQRLRCLHCMKVAYATEDEADAAVKTIESRGGPDMRYYLGPCGWYHATRRER